MVSSDFSEIDFDFVCDGLRRLEINLRLIKVIVNGRRC